jgi:hypothetical protein
MALTDLFIYKINAYTIPSTKSGDYSNCSVLSATMLHLSKDVN